MTGDCVMGESHEDLDEVSRLFNVTRNKKLLAELLSNNLRRVQITGGSSFMITLPKKWAESINMKNKDYILIREQPDGSLVLRHLSADDCIGGGGERNE